MKISAAFVFLALIGLPLTAQMPVGAHEARVGSDLQRFLRAAELAEGSNGPWRVQQLGDSSPLDIGLAQVRTGFNAGLPTQTRDDGPAWTGNGSFLQATGSLNWRAGPLRARVAPVLWWSQNTDVLLVPTASSAPLNPYVDPARPFTIDLPQQFGSGSIGRLDPGETELVAEWRYARAALTSAARHIGAGVDHSILMQGDGGGFARFEIGTPEAGVATPLGRVFGTLSSGRLAQSALSPANRTASRHGSFIDLRWSPLPNGAFELGASRFYHRDWNGWNAQDLFVPLGSLFFDEQVYAGGDADNQLAALYSRLKIPSAGMELYAEFGKNDRSRDIRDLALQLEHNAAWLAGVQRVWTSADGALWALNAVIAGARIAEIDSLRGQATFYEHSPIRQGHTQRGQLLGTPLLQGTGGSELRLDRYTSTGRRALILHTRHLPNRRGDNIPAIHLRSEWGLMTEWMHLTPRGAFHARLGGLADIGRHPTQGDVYSLHFTLGYTLSP